MSQELKPCPFCGGEAYFERTGTGRQSCIVECGSCGVRHESSDEYGRSGMSWNQRAQPAGEAEPIYQWRGNSIDKWTDTRKETYDNIGFTLDRYPADQPKPTWERRIVYAAPPAAANQAGTWQPIETAPKDGTAIDLWVDGEFSHRRPGCFWGLPHHCCGEMGSYCDSEWHDLEPGWVDDFNQPLSELDRKPTHWMPLPAFPHTESHALGGGDE